MDDFKELWPSAGSDGYTKRQWAMHDQFQNDMIDMFRKVINGSIRIPTREEVIDRTKVVVLQDVNSGNNDDKYSTPANLFEGLYRMDKDGNLKDNHTPFKRTGRYPTIPTAYKLNDDLAKSFDVQVKKSQFGSRWPSVSDKVKEMDKLFASEYWGNCYAARNENTWVTYNPFKTDESAGGYLSLKYNTCKELEVTYSKYTTGIINEFSDHLDVYLNNFDNKINTGLKTDRLKVYGAKSKPTFTYKDRGVNQKASVVSSDWSDGVFTLTIKHNGPVDLTINCSGNEGDKLTSYKKASIKAVDSPAVYDGPRQYEAEFYDYKNIEGNVTNGCNSGVTGYQGQGFMKFGTKSNAAIRDTVNVLESGKYNLKLRYAVTSNNKLDLYVNGSKVNTLDLKNTYSLSKWGICEAEVSLNKGANTIELKAPSALSSSLYLDNFTIEGKTSSGSTGSTTTPDTTVTPGSTVKLQDGWYYIKNVNAQKYLQVEGNEGKAGKNIELRTGFQSEGQRWYLKNVGDGYVTLKSALGDFMMDVDKGADEDGANIALYYAYSGEPQQFMIKSSSKDGRYVIATKCSDLTKVLDDYNLETADGTNVCQWKYNGNVNQQWIFEPVIHDPEKIEDEVQNTDKEELGLEYNISDWGSAYQVNFKVINNTSSDINNWTLKIKKTDINIGSSWNITIEEDKDYYIITPMSYNSSISKGNSIEFGIQGSGKIEKTISYILN